jgi:acyl carrier protein
MDKLTELVAAKAAMPAEWIEASTTIDDLAIESLDFIELIFEIEEAFDIKIPSDWDGEFATMGDLSDAIDRLKNSAASVVE